MNRFPLDEPIDVIGVWLYTPGAEIEIIVTVTDLWLWYNCFVIRSMFEFWSDLNSWEKLSLRCMDPPRWIEAQGRCDSRRVDGVRTVLM